MVQADYLWRFEVSSSQAPDAHVQGEVQISYSRTEPHHWDTQYKHDEGPCRASLGQVLDWTRRSTNNEHIWLNAEQSPMLSEPRDAWGGKKWWREPSRLSKAQQIVHLKRPERCWPGNGHGKIRESVTSRTTNVFWHIYLVRGRRLLILYMSRVYSKLLIILILILKSNYFNLLI